MNFIDSIKEFPDEESCKQKFKEYRDQVGVVCAKCSGESHYWKRDKEQYECKACGTRTTLKKGFSAKEIQRQLGHKRYAPIWHMVHKLRPCMGQKDEPLKRGRGSQKRTKVPVMAESEPVENPKKGKKPRRVGHLKMKVIDDLRKETIGRVVRASVPRQSGLHTDDPTSYVGLHRFVESHKKEVVPKEKLGKNCPGCT